MLKLKWYIKNLILIQGLIFVFCIHAFSQENSNLPSKTKINKDDLKKMRAVTVILKTNFLPIISGPLPNSGEYRLTGEFLVGKKHSITASAAYIGRSLLYMAMRDSATINGGQKMSINGYRVQMGYKYYIYNKPFTLKGIFVSPNFSLANAKYFYKSNPDYYLNISKFQANIYFGGQIAIANRYCLELFFGPGYKTSKWVETDKHRSVVIPPEDNGMGKLYNSNFSFVIGFNFGIAL